MYMHMRSCALAKMPEKDNHFNCQQVSDILLYFVRFNACNVGISLLLHNHTAVSSSKIKINNQ